MREGEKASGRPCAVSVGSSASPCPGVRAIVSVPSPPSLSLSQYDLCQRLSESDPCAATVTPPLLPPTTWGERRAGEQRNAINDTQMLPSAADTDISSPTRHFVNPGITLYIISASGVLAPS